jgi:hypothetical protein
MVCQVLLRADHGRVFYGTLNNVETRASGAFYQEFIPSNRYVYDSCQQEGVGQVTHLGLFLYLFASLLSWLAKVAERLRNCLQSNINPITSKRHGRVIKSCCSGYIRAFAHQ